MQHLATPQSCFHLFFICHTIAVKLYCLIHLYQWICSGDYWPTMTTDNIHVKPKDLYLFPCAWSSFICTQILYMVNVVHVQVCRPVCKKNSLFSSASADELQWHRTCLRQITEIHVIKLNCCSSTASVAAENKSLQGSVKGRPSDQATSHALSSKSLIFNVSIFQKAAWYFPSLVVSCVYKRRKHSAQKHGQYSQQMLTTALFILAQLSAKKSNRLVGRQLVDKTRHVVLAVVLGKAATVNADLSARRVTDNIFVGPILSPKNRLVWTARNINAAAFWRGMTRRSDVKLSKPAVWLSTLADKCRRHIAEL